MKLEERLTTQRFKYDGWVPGINQDFKHAMQIKTKFEKWENHNVVRTKIETYWKNRYYFKDYNSSLGAAAIMFRLESGNEVMWLFEQEDDRDWAFMEVECGINGNGEYTDWTTLTIYGYNGDEDETK